MANFIYSRVSIEPQEAMQKICNMIDNMPESEYGKETLQAVKTFYTQEELSASYNNGETRYPITENGVLVEWLYDNVGTKWIALNLEAGIGIESPSNIPDGFLIKLYSLCIQEFVEVKLICKWYDEFETNYGSALIYQGIYTEDQKSIPDEQISDPAYQISGQEEISVLKDWILTQVDDEGEAYLPEEELNSLPDEEVREVFEEWKKTEQWDSIIEGQELILKSCQEAIQDQLSFPEADIEFPIIKKIADNNKMIENCYPF